MKTSNFDQLLQRYLTNQVTEQEKQKIETWLELRKTEKITEEEMSKEDQEKLFKRITQHKEDAKEFKIALKKSRRRSPGWWLLRVAAVLLVGLSAFYFGWYGPLNKQSQPLTVNAAGIEKLILQDGSIVWLKDHSKIVYSENTEPGIRFAKLDGEALFEVAKDATRPFILDCGEISIKVLGTSFNVRTSKEGLELKVLTGTVNVSRVSDTSTLIVKPNEMVIYSANKELQKQPMESEEVLSVTVDTEYDMVFNNTPMNEVSERISKKFNVRVKLENKNAGKCRIKADFTDRSLESTLKMITEVLDFTYTRTDDRILISGKGCN